MLGVCYYPEHWPEAFWAEDARAMREAGITYVRIGEFAWSRIEPEPGQYEWAWLDRAIATLGEGRHVTSSPARFREVAMSSSGVSQTVSASGIAARSAAVSGCP